MQIYIYSKVRVFNLVLCDFVVACVAAELHQSQDKIRRVEVHLTTANGLKSDGDTCCVVRIYTDYLAEVTVKDVEEDSYAAVSRALVRVKRIFERKLEYRNIIGY